MSFVVSFNSHQAPYDSRTEEKMPLFIRELNVSCLCLIQQTVFVLFWLFSVISPIDGKSMESITSVKIFHGSEFKANGKVIRWTEVQHM